MSSLRMRSRAIASRLAVIDAYDFPAGVRNRFSARHQALSADDLRLVEDGARQWFRLVARYPRTMLAMPSVVVGDLWHDLILHTADYAALCATAFAPFSHHTPDSATGAGRTAARRVSGLAVTYRLAREDEPGTPLPLLFRVDSELGIDGGRRYRPDCGGHESCAETTDVACLRHTAGR